jgi:putative ABC transport system permease protein
VLESLIVLAVGYIDGTLLGLYGHALAGRWLQLTTGFPAPFSLGIQGMLGALVLVAGITLLVVALPGLSAARVPPRVGFQE